MKKTVLNLYSIKETDLSQVFPDAEITQKSIHEIDSVEGTYDVVFSRHSLPTIEPYLVPLTIKKMASLLNPMGELVLMTPALEWAATQVFSDNPSPAFHALVYGAKDDHYRTGFALKDLRNLVEGYGLFIRRSGQEPYDVQMGEQLLPVIQNIIIGWNFKMPETNDTSNDTPAT